MTGMTKTCNYCQQPFDRRHGLSNEQWNTQRFCSQLCGRQARDHVSDPRPKFFAQIMPVTESGCWIWMGGLTSYGYGNLHIGHRSTGAHQFSYEVHKGRVPDGLVICHHCDVRCCVNPDHLYAGTTDQNNKDAARRGRTCRGEQSPFAKLTRTVVDTIRASSETTTDLARLYGVSRQAVSNARTGKTWGAL